MSAGYLLYREGVVWIGTANSRTLLGKGLLVALVQPRHRVQFDQVNPC